MPGAWELPKTVVCGILHTEIVTMAWALGLKNLQIPGPIVPVAGVPFDHARNKLCMIALEHGADFVFHYDSDVVAPHDTIFRLMRHNLPIVSGVYCRRAHPQGIPVMLRNGQWITEFPSNALIEVDLVGAGCLLIRRDVLEKLPPQDKKRGKHWFDWKVDCKGTGIAPDDECASEDFTLCRHASKHGFKVMVDTSIICRHIGLGEAGLGTFKPCDVTPNT